MKSSKFVCRAAIFMLAVSFMHNEAANCERMPITLDTFEEVKEIKLKILAYFS